MKLNNVIPALILITPSYSAFADFSLPSKGTFTYPTGVIKELGLNDNRKLKSSL